MTISLSYSTDYHPRPLPRPPSTSPPRPRPTLTSMPTLRPTLRRTVAQPTPSSPKLSGLKLRQLQVKTRPPTRNPSRSLTDQLVIRRSSTRAQSQSQSPTRTRTRTQIRKTRLRQLRSSSSAHLSMEVGTPMADRLLPTSPEHPVRKQRVTAETSPRATTATTVYTETKLKSRRVNTMGMDIMLGSSNLQGRPGQSLVMSAERAGTEVIPMPSHWRISTSVNGRRYVPLSWRITMGEVADPNSSTLDRVSGLS